MSDDRNNKEIDERYTVNRNKEYEDERPRNQSDHEDDKYFDLKGSIDDNYSIIAVMGIFGAISIYLGQISVDVSVKNQIINAGIFSSLFIFVLMAMIINKELLTEFRDFIDSRIEVFSLLGIEGISLTLFILPFNIMVGSVMIMSLDFDSVGAYILGTAVMLVGFAAGAEVMLYIMSEVVLENTSDRSPKWLFINVPLVISFLILGIIFVELYRIGIETNILILFSDGGLHLYLMAFLYGITASQIFIVSLELIVVTYGYTLN